MPSEKRPTVKGVFMLDLTQAWEKFWAYGNLCAWENAEKSAFSVFFPLLPRKYPSFSVPPTISDKKVPGKQKLPGIPDARIQLFLKLSPHWALLGFDRTKYGVKLTNWLMYLVHLNHLKKIFENDSTYVWIVRCQKILIDEMLTKKNQILGASFVWKFLRIFFQN